MTSHRGCYGDYPIRCGQPVAAAVGLGPQLQPPPLQSVLQPTEQRKFPKGKDDFQRPLAVAAEVEGTTSVDEARQPCAEMGGKSCCACSLWGSYWGSPAEGCPLVPCGLGADGSVVTVGGSIPPRGGWTTYNHRRSHRSQEQCPVHAYSAVRTRRHRREGASRKPEKSEDVLEEDGISPTAR